MLTLAVIRNWHCPLVAFLNGALATVVYSRAAASSKH